MTLEDGNAVVQQVDHVVVCAGQESHLPEALIHPNMTYIGGARMRRHRPLTAIKEEMLPEFVVIKSQFEDAPWPSRACRRFRLMKGRAARGRICSMA